MHYRANGIGFTTDRHAQAFLVPAPDPWAEPVPAAVLMLALDRARQRFQLVRVTPDGCATELIRSVVVVSSHDARSGRIVATYQDALTEGDLALVDAGYKVLACTPRGSAGYGQAHGCAIRRRLGTVDRSDVLLHPESPSGICGANRPKLSVAISP